MTFEWRLLNNLGGSYMCNVHEWEALRTRRRQSIASATIVPECDLSFILGASQCIIEETR